MPGLPPARTFSPAGPERRGPSAPCARASPASPRGPRTRTPAPPRHSGAAAFRLAGFPRPAASARGPRSRGCSWGVRLPDSARWTSASGTIPIFSRVLCLPPQSRRVCTEVARGVGPPPPRLDAGPLSGRRGARTRGRSSCGCKLSGGRTNEMQTEKGPPAFGRVSWSARSGADAPRAPRAGWKEAARRSLRLPLRAAAGAQRACALPGAGGRAERSRRRTSLPRPPQRPQKPWKLGSGKLAVVLLAGVPTRK